MTLAGRRITGRSHPIRIGTWTAADCATRTGLPIPSRADRSAIEKLLASEAVRLRRLTTMQPYASRAVKVTTPSNQAGTASNTNHGKTCSTAGRALNRREGGEVAGDSLTGAVGAGDLTTE